MKLSTILESKNVTQFRFNALTLNDLSQLLANTAEESPFLLKAYDFSGYDVFDFNEKIEKFSYEGFEEFSKPQSGEFHTYKIIIENDKGVKMIHKVSVHIGEKTLYCEIYDGKAVDSPNQQAHDLLSSALKKLSSSPNLSDAESKEIEDLISKAYGILDTSGKISYELHNSIENVLDDMGGDGYDIDDVINQLEQIIDEL